MDKAIWMSGGCVVLAIGVLNGSVENGVFRHEVVVQRPDGTAVRGTTPVLADGGWIDESEVYDSHDTMRNRVQAVADALDATGYGTLRNDVLGG